MLLKNKTDISKIYMVMQSCVVRLLFFIFFLRTELKNFLLFVPSEYEYILYYIILYR